VSPSPFRIFIVDDERSYRLNPAAILEMNGFKSSFFVDPLEALDAATKQSPDLLISDVVMPGLSGVDLALRIQALCPTCKILLFSGQAATADLLQAAHQQGHDFRLLLKPVEPTELLAEISVIAFNS
jgi:CheY-like chemotaxis protein